MGERSQLSIIKEIETAPDVGNRFGSAIGWGCFVLPAD
jgi:hypothetical protein